MWEEQEYGQGKCINCGYLGKSDNTLGQECHTAKADERTIGNLAHHIVPGIVSLDTVPRCFITKANLKNEVEQLGSQSKGVSPTLVIIEKDRNCPSWYPWTEYFSPKEHFEEFKMQQLEDNRRAFEERLDNSNKEFLAGLEHERREWEKDAGKWPKRLIWAAILLAVAEVVSNVPVIQRFLGLD